MRSYGGGRGQCGWSRAEQMKERVVPEVVGDKGQVPEMETL